MGSGSGLTGELTVRDRWINCTWQCNHITVGDPNIGHLLCVPHK